MMKRAGAAILLTACILAPVTLAQTPQPPPKPTAEDIWMDAAGGRWTGEGEIKASPFGPAGKFTYTEDIGKTEVAWVPSGFFQVMHWDWKGTEGEAQGLTIFGYNAEEKMYYSFTFSSAGGAGLFRGRVEGDTLTLTSGEFKRDGKTMRRRYISKRLSPTVHATREEYSSEGGPWLIFREGKATKTP